MFLKPWIFKNIFTTDHENCIKEMYTFLFNVDRLGKITILQHFKIVNNNNWCPKLMFFNKKCNFRNQCSAGFTKIFLNRIPLT